MPGLVEAPSVIASRPFPSPWAPRRLATATAQVGALAFVCLALTRLLQEVGGHSDQVDLVSYITGSHVCFPPTRCTRPGRFGTHTALGSVRRRRLCLPADGSARPLASAPWRSGVATVGGRWPGRLCRRGAPDREARGGQWTDACSSRCCLPDQSSRTALRQEWTSFAVDRRRHWSDVAGAPARLSRGRRWPAEGHSGHWDPVGSPTGRGSSAANSCRCAGGTRDNSLRHQQLAHVASGACEWRARLPEVVVAVVLRLCRHSVGRLAHSRCAVRRFAQDPK